MIIYQHSAGARFSFGVQVIFQTRMTRMTRIFKAALYIPAYHTEGKKNPRHPCHPCLKDYLHAEGEPCSSATLVNYHLS